MIKTLLFNLFSFSKKSFAFNVKLMCLGMFFVVSFSNAATFYSRQDGNWNSLNTWSTSSGGSAVTTLPGSNDDVILENGNVITVTANASCKTILFNSTNNILSVNPGVTLTVGGNTGTSGITLDSSNSNDRVATITGGGTLVTRTLAVGNNATPSSGNTITTVLTSTIANFNIAGNLSIVSRRNNSSYNNATFYLSSGILNVDGQITISNQNNNNTSTFSMATGLQSANLLLGNGTPFALGSGISNINLNGSNSTVNYDGAAQTVFTTDYNNLISSGSGNKTVSGSITVNKDFTLNAGTFALSNGTNTSALTVKGDYLQTGGVFDFNLAANQSYITYLNLAGNFTVNTGASSMITSGSNAYNGTIVFNGAGIQKVTVPTPEALVWVMYVVNLGSTVQLASNLTLTNSNVAPANYTGTFTTKGTLDLKTFQIVQSGGIGGSSIFSLEKDATLITANAGGVNGAISATNMTRTFNSGANYVFNGTVAQITSTSMPTTVNSLSINNIAGVTLSQATAITNDFSLTSGSTADLGTSFVHTAKTITLNGAVQSSGSWGGTGSAATNKSALYFGTSTTAKGIVNISSTTCTTGYWTGVASTDWKEPANWCGGVPTASTDVIIPAGTPFQPTIGSSTNALAKNLTINASATVTLSTTTSSLNISGNFVNNGNVSGVLGSLITFSGTVTQSIGGFTTLGNVSMTKTGGVATFTGAVNAAALTINGAGGTLNLGASLTHTFTGDITLSAGSLNGGSSTLNANSSTATSWNGTGTNFTAGTGTVNFGGAAQTIATTTTFNNLILSGTGTKTLGVVIIAPNLTITGVTATNTSTLTVSAALSGTGILVNSASGTLNIGGTNTINTLNAIAVGNTVNYNGATQTVAGTVYSNLALSNSGTKTLSAVTTVAGNLTNASTVTLATANFGLTLGGNFTNTGIVTAGSSAITINGTASQNIAGFSTTGQISITKTGLTTFTSSVSTTGNLSISSGAVVDLGNILTHTAGTLTLNGNGQNGDKWGGSAATTATNKSATYFGTTAIGIVTVASPSCTPGYWTGITSTDWNTASNWCGGTVPTSAIDVVIPTGTPFMPTISAAPIAAVNNLTINAAASLTLSNSANSLLNISGNFVNNGTFTAGAASVVSLVGGNQTIASGTYGNLTFASGTKTFAGNTIITNNLIFSSGAILNLNGITTHTTGTLTLNGSGPLLSSWGASNSGATNTNDTYFTGSGIITVTLPAPYPAIGRNFASYTKGVYGKVADSYKEGVAPDFNAPVGTVFINVDFASYGLPSGLPAPFTLGTCDAFNSRTVATKFLGNTTAKIPATNGVFGDPCYGTEKRLSIQATYTEPICAGTSPGVITGSDPNGGNGTFTFLWSVSTTGAEATDYVPASGTNNSRDYKPGLLSVTTWYKRTVTSGMYSNETIVIVPVNNTPTSPTTITNSASICAGDATTLSVSGGNKGGNGGYTQWYTGSCGGTGVLIGTGDDITVTPTATTTYYARYMNGCGASTCLSTTITTTVGITHSATANPVCQKTTSQNTTLAYTAIKGGANRYNIVWSTTPANSFANVPDTALPAPNSGLISIVVPANTSPGTYTGVINVKNAGNCSSFGENFTIQVNPPLTTPTVGAVTPISCTAATGSIALSDLPAGSWTITQSGFASATINGTGSTTTISGLAKGSYSFTVTDASCTSGATASIEIKDDSETIWNGGTAWSNGNPTKDKRATITSVSPNQPFIGDSNPLVYKDFYACSLTITNGSGEVVVPSNVNLIVTNEVVTSGNLRFKNNSSLVQVSNTATNSGNIFYERSTTPILRKDYVYWSTPVNPQTLGALSPSSSLMYSNDGTKWVAAAKTSNMIVGSGYIVRGPDNYSNATRQVFPAVFTGVPNNGDIVGELLLADRSYVIGNPYPCALNADMLLGQNKMLDGTIYFWTHNTPQNVGAATQYTPDDYAAYNTSGGVSTSAKSDGGHNDDPSQDNGKKPTGKIAAGQGFYVGTNLSGNVKFTNSMRLGASDNSQFFKPGAAGAVEKNRIWLNMTNANGVFKQLLVSYIEGATNDYENRYDGLSFNANPYLDFYSVGNNVNYVIQGRALPFVDTDIVPLGYETTIKGEFTISIDEVDGKMSNQAIYLEDKTTGEIHDLRASDYTFKTEIGTFQDRLILRYAGRSLGTGDFENLENGILVSVKKKVIDVLSSKENIKEVTVFDVSGKLLYNKKKVGNTELQIQNLSFGDQVLLVKVTLENDFTTTKKIVF